MIFLGLILAAAATVVGVSVVLDNTGASELTAFGETVPGVTSQWHVFLAGAAVAIVFMAGMTVATLGIGRAIRIRKELRELRDEHEESMTTMELEKRQLQRELARARREAGIGSIPQQPMAPHSS
ncbi:hypothetical protein [Actinomadura sp. HBU206391]|uniref:hypothetical protein n=1 Tax=Actinomadura sp. HBU206391 TaxID=2731692 RepID=UPI00164EFF11|nr:hypothetical protein [Actinomadura sp. HBU206391]MBC6459551.1 hypothetical protein [Actinomadura sp. HBU206391]